MSTSTKMPRRGLRDFIGCPRILRSFVSLFIILFMLISLFPNGLSAGYAYTRLGGETQYDTAARIAASNWTTADTAVIVVGTVGNSYDALAAGPLAAQKVAPLLLTEGDKLTSVTLSSLQSLHVKKVYLIGGTGVIKAAVEQAIQAMGITVTRLAGYDASETSVKIAQEMGVNPTSVVLTGGKGQDALSVAPIAAAQKMPILYTNSKEVLPSSLAAYLNSVKGNIQTSYIVGGTGVISDKQGSSLPGQIKRFFGETAYDTNVAVMDAFVDDLSFDNIYIANGQTMVDALAGVPLAAIEHSALVLTDNREIKAANFINERQGSQTRIVVLGGEAVVSQTLLNQYLNSIEFYPIIPQSFSLVDKKTLKADLSRSVTDPSQIKLEVKRDGVIVNGLQATWNAAKTGFTLSSVSDLDQGEYSIALSGPDISTQFNTASCSVLTDPDAVFKIKDMLPLAGFKEVDPVSTAEYSKLLEFQGTDKSGRVYSIKSDDILSVISSDNKVVKIGKEKDGWYAAGADVSANGNTAVKSAVLTVQIKTLYGVKTIEQTIKVSPEQPKVQQIKIGYDRIKFSKDLGNFTEQTTFVFANVIEAREGIQLGGYGQDQYGIWRDIVPSQNQVVVKNSNDGPSNSFMIYEEKPCSNLTRYLLELGPIPEEQVVRNKDIKVNIYYDNAVKEITVKLLAS